MNQNMLFEAGLGLNSPWKVVRSGLEDGGGGSKFLYVDHGWPVNCLVSFC
jgi:hypothetical protein